MRNINEFLNDLSLICSKSELDKLNDIYSIENHSAIELDEYMKNQYVVTLYSVVANCDTKEVDAGKFLYYLCKSINYEFNAENITKDVYKLNNEKLKDLSVSFEGEDIRFLLALDMQFVILSMNNPNACENYVSNLLELINVHKEDIPMLKCMAETILKNDLSVYQLHNRNKCGTLFQCYLHKFNFSKERCLVRSNCLSSIRTSDYPRSYRPFEVVKSTYFAEAIFQTEFKIREYNYVEKRQVLGNFIERVFGVSVGIIGTQEDWDRQDNAEKTCLKSQMFKNYSQYDFDYTDNNTCELVDICAEKSGILFMFCTCIDKYDLPIAIISHPLDNEIDVEDEFAKLYNEILNN